MKYDANSDTSKKVNLVDQPPKPTPPNTPLIATLLLVCVIAGVYIYIYDIRLPFLHRNENDVDPNKVVEKYEKEPVYEAKLSKNAQYGDIELHWKNTEKNVATIEIVEDGYQQTYTVTCDTSYTKVKGTSYVVKTNDTYVKLSGSEYYLYCYKNGSNKYMGLAK